MGALEAAGNSSALLEAFKGAAAAMRGELLEWRRPVEAAAPLIKLHDEVEQTGAGEEAVVAADSISGGTFPEGGNRQIDHHH